MIFNLNARADRLSAALAIGACFLIQVALQRAIENDPGWLRIAAPILVLTLIIQIVALAQRLHDAGHKGTLAVLGVVPAFNLLAVLIALSLPPREGWQPARRTPLSHVVVYTLFGLMMILGALRYAYQISYAPSSSMKPTLIVGDAFVVPLLDRPEVTRGDVVVFRHPVSGVDYVKRVIGLPGDTVQMVDGTVVLNGEPLRREALPDFVEPYVRQGGIGALPLCIEDTAALTKGADCTKHRFREVLPDGRSYEILDIGLAVADNTATFEVPAGMLFMLGDNRDNSVDSRYAQSMGGLGFIPAENLRGKVTRLLFSAAGPYLYGFWDWRPNRLLRTIE